MVLVGASSLHTLHQLYTSYTGCPFIAGLNVQEMLILTFKALCGLDSGNLKDCLAYMNHMPV